VARHALARSARPAAPRRAAAGRTAAPRRAPPRGRRSCPPPRTRRRRRRAPARARRAAWRAARGRGPGGATALRRRGAQRLLSQQAAPRAFAQDQLRRLATLARVLHLLARARVPGLEVDCAAKRRSAPTRSLPRRPWATKPAARGRTEALAVARRRRAAAARDELLRDAGTHSSAPRDDTRRAALERPVRGASVEHLLVLLSRVARGRQRRGGGVRAACHRSGSSVVALAAEFWALRRRTEQDKQKIVQVVDGARRARARGALQGTDRCCTHALYNATKRKRRVDLLLGLPFGARRPRAARDGGGRLFLAPSVTGDGVRRHPSLAPVPCCLERATAKRLLPRLPLPRTVHATT